MCRSFQITGPEPKSKQDCCMIRSGNTVLVLLMRGLFGVLTVLIIISQHTKKLHLHPLFPPILLLLVNNFHESQRTTMQS